MTCPMIHIGNKKVRIPQYLLSVFSMVKLVLDYDVSFAEQVPPVVSGSGVYNMNFASYAADHNPDGRPYYTKGELGY